MMIGRAAWLQLVPDSRLKSLQKRQFETVVTLKPRRGDVVDRNGHELAVSMASYSLFADPKIIEDHKKAVRLLAKELKLPVKQLEDKIRNRKKRFVWIARNVDKSERDAIDAQLKEQKIRGLGFVEESRRIYPNDRLLSHVLGFVGREESGLEGLELKYNDKLEASTQQVSVRKDARGRPLIVNGQMFTQVPDGADVQLTIDRELQFILEQELAQTVVKHEADSAVGIVLDAQTSEVLAMASSPSFDPNKASDFTPDRKRNRAITDAFEPGSTMKTFVIAGALNKGLIEPNTKFDCENGSMRIGNRVIREADAKHKFQSLSVSEILAYSSNVGTTKIAFKLGPESLQETLKVFGFGDRSGVDLPGEAKGIMQPLPWRDHLMANISFGHGVAVTPLQIANAYAVIANGGWLRKPYVVKSILDHENGQKVEVKPQTVRRVLTDEAVAKMRMILTGTTNGDGTGINARVPGFPVAGKTGTAQKVNPNGRGYIQGGYISSFAGFLPSNDPRFVIYIAVDRPRKEYYGSAVAAPVFSRVARFAVRRMGLTPVLLSEENVVPNKPAMPHLDSVVSDSSSLAVAVETGDSAEDEKPIAAKIEEAAQSAVGSFEPKTGQPIETVVPDLTGLTLREVLSRVAGTGVSVQIKGQGYVTATVPAAGARLGDNRNLTVILARSNE